ncbi:hypothetical protein OV079_14235 [Nannocystis pusilla]|uniref:Uncharacterized protein n=1 Tax=Nannocystis pusilla TaxID=889268 RepID=A0A9X3IYB3_9BACT|nr:hypothetical protein [Nannocystis pusilla]MCY1006688.1 hypothetical protein [Nannocystis pusilla]
MRDSLKLAALADRQRRGAGLEQLDRRLRRLGVDREGDVADLQLDRQRELLAGRDRDILLERQEARVLRDDQLVRAGAEVGDQARRVARVLDAVDGDAGVGRLHVELDRADRCGRLRRRGGVGGRDRLAGRRRGRRVAAGDEHDDDHDQQQRADAGRRVEGDRRRTLAGLGVLDLDLGRDRVRLGLRDRARAGDRR